MATSTNFTTDIFESKPVLLNSRQFIADLNTGKVSSTKPDINFVRKIGTVKSTIHFTSANIDEGVFNLFFIQLDNNQSFIFLLGNINPISIFVGGNFLSGSDTLHFNTSILQDYINDNIKEWQKLYSASDIVGIINSANLLIRNIYDRI
jgi:hypothetical protein